MEVDQIGFALVADVIGIEPGGDKAHGRVEEDVPLLLVQPEAAGPTGERAGVRFEFDMVCVGTLEVVGRSGLEPENRLGIAGDPGSAKPAVENPVPVLVQKTPSVEAQSERVIGKLPLQTLFLLADDRRPQETDAVSPILQVLLKAEQGVVCERFYNPLTPMVPQDDIRVLPGSDGVENPNVPTVPDLSRHLRGPQNRRPVRGLRPLPLRIPLRGSPDPAAVKKLRFRPVDVRIGGCPSASEVEDPRPFDEKGPLLLVVGLIGREVELGRIDLHLTEVGVQCQIESQVALHPPLHVHTHVPVEAAGIVQGVSALLRLEGPLADNVGDDIEMGR